MVTVTVTVTVVSNGRKRTNPRTDSENRELTRALRVGISSGRLWVEEGVEEARQPDTI